MPSFKEDAVKVLKQQMMARLPECYFTQDDVNEIMEKTGLNAAQILQWAEHLRLRIPKQSEREQTLRGDESFSQDVKTRFNRCLVTCFNVDRQAMGEFKFLKSKGEGFFNLVYMDAAFNSEAESAEIFMQFEEKVWDNKLIEQLEKIGACQIFVITFTNNDNNESAASALARVWTTAEKHGSQLVKGVCPETLLSKTKEKFAKAKDTSTEAWSTEKIQAAIKMSMVGVENKLDNVDVKVDNMKGKINNVEQGVCLIIPDIQKELKELKEKYAHKTKEVDRIEYRMGRMTHEINQRDETIALLNKDLENSTVQIKQLEREKDQQIIEMQGLHKMIKLYEANDAAKWLIETTQAYKRPRIDE